MFASKRLFTNFIRSFSKSSKGSNPPLTTNITMPMNDYVDRRIGDKYSELKTMIQEQGNRLDSKIDKIDSKFETLQKTLPTTILLTVSGSLVGILGSAASGYGLYSQYHKNTLIQNK